MSGASMATSSKAAMTRASDSGTRWVSSATGCLLKKPEVNR